MKSVAGKFHAPWNSGVRPMCAESILQWRLSANGTIERAMRYVATLLIRFTSGP